MQPIPVSLLEPKAEGEICREDPQEFMENIQRSVDKSKSIQL